MQSKEWPINSIFNKHLLSIHQVLVIKDTKINLKIVPALEKLTVQQQQQRRIRKQIVSSAVWKFCVKGGGNTKGGGANSA